MDLLPNEIRLKVFRNFDLSTALQYLQLGRESDNELMYKFLKFEVGVKVNYVKKGFMEVELLDLKTKNVAMTWHIEEIRANVTTIRQMDSAGNSLYHVTMKKTRFSDAAFQIAGRIFSKPMLRVKKLFLNLSKFPGNVKFGKPIEYLEELYLSKCSEAIMKKIRFNFATAPRRLLSDVRNSFTSRRPPVELKIFGTSEIYFGLQDVFEHHNFFENGSQQLKNRDGSINEHGIAKLINILQQPTPENSSTCGCFWITSEVPGLAINFEGHTEYKSYYPLGTDVFIATFCGENFIKGIVKFNAFH